MSELAEPAPAVQPSGPGRARMGPEAVRDSVEAFKQAGIDLLVNMPEEPTSALIDAVREDPYFTLVTVANESHGIALTGGAAIAGRPAVFVTGVAGLMVGTWAMAQMGVVYAAPFIILAAYRGDFGDQSGIPGSQLMLFKRLGEPLLQAIGLPYVVVEDPAKLKKAILNAHAAAQAHPGPTLVLLTGEVLW